MKKTDDDDQQVWWMIDLTWRWMNDTDKQLDHYQMCDWHFCFSSYIDRNIIIWNHENCVWNLYNGTIWWPSPVTATKWSSPVFCCSLFICAMMSVTLVFRSFIFIYYSICDFVIFILFRRKKLPKKKWKLTFYNERHVCVLLCFCVIHSVSQ